MKKLMYAIALAFVLTPTLTNGHDSYVRPPFRYEWTKYALYGGWRPSVIVIVTSPGKYEPRQRMRPSGLIPELEKMKLRYVKPERRAR